MERLSALICGFVVAGYAMAFLLRYPTALSAALSVAAAAWVGSRVPGAAAALQRRWPIPRRLWLALVVGALSLSGTAHAQRLTLGLDTRGVDAQATQAEALGPPPQQEQAPQAQPAAQQAQPQQGKPEEKVKRKEIDEVVASEAKKIYQQRMGVIVARENELRGKMRWLVDPILGKWNLHLYYGSHFPTGGQCSGETGPGPCVDGFEYKERRRGEQQRLGVQLTVNPLYSYGLGFWRVGTYVGGNFGLGWLPTGMGSSHLLEFGAFVHFAFLGVLNFRAGGGGMLEQWGTKSPDPTIKGLIQRSVVPGHGDFSVGVQLGRLGFNMGCRVRQDGYLNLDGTSGGSWGIQCGPEMHGVFWGHFKPGEQPAQ